MKTQPQKQTEKKVVKNYCKEAENDLIEKTKDKKKINKISTKRWNTKHKTSTSTRKTNEKTQNNHTNLTGKRNNFDFQRPKLDCLLLTSRHLHPSGRSHNKSLELSIYSSKSDTVTVCNSNSLILISLFTVHSPTCASVTVAADVHPTPPTASRAFILKNHLEGEEFSANKDHSLQKKLI